MTAHNRERDFASFSAGTATSTSPSQPPLLARKDHDHPSLFLPEVMLQEARRQKRLADAPVPDVCLLDPDGDIAAFVRERLAAERCHTWACFHSELWEWRSKGMRFGVVGRAVGASFSVLIAEQLFVSGCRLLISIASAGAIAPGLPKPCYVLIEKALRDEGTSYHYLPPSAFVSAPADLFALALSAAASLRAPVMAGTSWTTDAPFRETAAAVAARQEQGIHTVEMEAAALLAFAEAKKKPVVAIAHVTNELGLGSGDFDKGADHGAETALAIAGTIALRAAKAGYLSAHLE